MSEVNKPGRESQLVQKSKIQKESNSFSLSMTFAPRLAGPYDARKKRVIYIVGSPHYPDDQFCPVKQGAARKLLLFEIKLPGAAPAVPVTAAVSRWVTTTAASGFPAF